MSSEETLGGSRAEAKYAADLRRRLHGVGAHSVTRPYGVVKDKPSSLYLHLSYEILPTMW